MINTEVTGRYVIKSDDERFMLAEVYIPIKDKGVSLVDTDGEYMRREVVKAQAHRFLLEGRIDCIDLGHNREKSGVKVCESFIVRGKHDPDGFAEGAWVLGLKGFDSLLWHKVKSGEFNGLSWSGPATVVPVLAEIDHPLRMVGKSEPYPINDPSAHTHDLDLAFDDNALVVPGETGPGPDGHVHKVEHTTATESVHGHAHRIVIDTED